MCVYNASDMDSCDSHSCDERDAIKALERELNKSKNEDLTNEEIFIRDWDKRPVSEKSEYLCPAEVAALLPQRYNDEFLSGCIGLDLDLTDPNRCKNCKERFWKSKYKKPEKKEV